MMRALRCRLLGHREVAARRSAPVVIPTIGLVGGWEQVEPEESRGIGCNRCGLYVEHAWVAEARRVTGEEP